MSLKSLLASAGLVETEAPSPSPLSAPTALPSVEPRPKALAAAPPASSVDQGSLKQLMAEVNSAAPELYFKFQEMAQRMAGIPGMSDSAKREAAAAAVGITGPEIAQAVDAMLKRLAQEEAEYARVVEAAMQERVVSKRAEVDSLRQQITTLEGEIAQSAADIQAGALTFKQTVDHARAQIEKMR